MAIALTSQNFSVVSGKNGRVLKISVPGNALVFFKATVCPGCAEVDPIFAALAAKDHRVSYFTINIDDYRDVVMMARGTSVPIQTVPMLVLYVNQYPKAKFTGAKNLPSIQSFLTKALQSAASSSSSGGSGGGHVSQTVASSAMPHQQFMAPPHGAAGGGYYAPPHSGGVPPQGHVYQPDFASSGGMNSVPGIRGGANKAGPSYPRGADVSVGVDDEEETYLLSPPTIIPHNTPWDTRK